MDITSIQYFAEAAKDLNFTQTAKRLYISQQNLSNHIARLEKHYGVQLFERKPKLALTYSGEILLEYAKNQLLAEENLKSTFANLKSESVGALQIGCSPNRTSIIITEVVKQFLECYPDVKIHLHHYHSKQLSEKVLSGELDFSISVPQKARPNLSVTPLFTDYIMLLVKDSLLRKYFKNDTDRIILRFQQGANVREFSCLPLVTFRESKLVDSCYQEEDCVPNLAITSNYPQFFTREYYEDFAATIISYGNFMHIKHQLSNDIYAFPILVKGERVFHEISFIRHRQKYLPPYGQYFFNLTKEYFRSLI